MHCINTIISFSNRLSALRFSTNGTGCLGSSMEYNKFVSIQFIVRAAVYLFYLWFKWVYYGYFQYLVSISLSKRARFIDFIDLFIYFIDYSFVSLRNPTYQRWTSFHSCHHWFLIYFCSKELSMLL